MWEELKVNQIFMTSFFNVPFAANKKMYMNFFVVNIFTQFGHLELIVERLKIYCCHLKGKNYAWVNVCNCLPLTYICIFGIKISGAHPFYFKSHFTTSKNWKHPCYMDICTRRLNQNGNLHCEDTHAILLSKRCACYSSCL